MRRIRKVVSAIGVVILGGWGSGLGITLDGESQSGAAFVNPPAPTYLEATPGNRSVQLAWSSGGELAYDDGDFERTQSADGPDRLWAVRMDAEGINKVKEIVFYMSNPETIAVYGWEDNGPWVSGQRMPGTAPYDSITVLPANGWTKVDVSELGWVFNGNFYIGYMQQRAYKPRLGVDTAEPDKGRSVVSTPGFGWDTWDHISQISGLPNGNFGIRAVLEVAEDLVEYRVYRSRLSGDYENPLLSVFENSHEDSTVDTRITYYYVVTAVYDIDGVIQESAFSPEESIIIYGPEYELAFDDGIAEVGFNIGQDNALAVRFTPRGYPVRLTKLRYYINTGQGDFVMKVWDDDGIGGMPQSELYSDTATSSSGWFERNLRGLPDSIWITDGDFYVGWKELESTPTLGLDENAPDVGKSWFWMDGIGWQPLSYLLGDYDLMIRVIVDSSMVNIVEDQGLEHRPWRCELLQSYPNPFNATTAISYTVPTLQSSSEGRSLRTTLKVYNVLGQQVRSLVDEPQVPGHHVVIWNGRDGRGHEVASGVYLFRLEVGDLSRSGRTVLLR